MFQVIKAQKLMSTLTGGENGGTAPIAVSKAAGSKACTVM